MPFMLVGAILNAVGCGLIGLLSTSTSIGEWIGYQIIFGAGRGLAMSVVSYRIHAITETVNHSNRRAANSGYSA